MVSPMGSPFHHFHPKTVRLWDETHCPAGLRLRNGQPLLPCILKRRRQDGGKMLQAGLHGFVGWKSWTFGDEIEYGCGSKPFSLFFLGMRRRPCCHTVGSCCRIKTYLKFFVWYALCHVELFGQGCCICTYMSFVGLIHDLM